MRRVFFFFFFLGRAYKDIEEAACAGAALQGCCMFFTCSFHTLLLQPLHCCCSASEPEDKAPRMLFDSNTTDSRGLLSFFPFSGQKCLKLDMFWFSGPPVLVPSLVQMCSVCTGVRACWRAPATSASDERSAEVFCSEGERAWLFRPV